MVDASDEHPSRTGDALTDLAVGRRHRVRPPGCARVARTIHAGAAAHVPDPITPMPPDDEPWRLARLDLSHD